MTSWVSRESFTYCTLCENNGEADGAVKLLASESGEVILIPYVFSMMFLPRALSARGQNARPRRRKTRHVLANCADVIIRAHEEFLEEQSCVQKLARKESN
jgi:hypothetical protein